MEPATVEKPAPASFPQEAAQTAEPGLDFVAVYHSNFTFVWRNLKRLGVSESSIDDASQEVFITVHRRLADFEGRASLKTWIFGILLNVVRHHRRTMARRGEHEALSETVADPRGGNALESIARTQAVQALHGFLDDLDDSLRECFVLSELEQMTAPEISLVTGVNLHTVHSRIAAGRQRFEQMVARRQARDPWRKL